MKRKLILKFLVVGVAIDLALTAIFTVVGVHTFGSGKQEGTYVDDPALIATCIAELTYMTPRQDRLRQLTEAVEQCRLEQRTRSGRRIGGGVSRTEKERV